MNILYENIKHLGKLVTIATMLENNATCLTSNKAHYPRHVAIQYDRDIDTSCIFP